jgi:hypothetical protein
LFEGGSKAVVSRLAGPAAALESERAYARHVLPAGVRTGLADLVIRRDVAGLQRAAAIVVGFLATVAGYGVGLMRLSRAAERRGWTGERLTWLGSAIERPSPPRA